MAGEGGAAVLQVLVQNLIDLSKSEISLIRGLHGEAQNLIQNLDTIQQFLNDAETQTIPTKAVKSWLKRLENAAFEADNVLDELRYHSLSKTLHTNINKQKVPTCFSPFIDYARKRKMAVSIKEINKDLKSINATATELGLQKILADTPTAPYAGMETDAFSADPIFIGRNEVVSEIVKTLITSVATHERVFSILPIVGMGGLGKTTLTRRVFHHQNIETQFGSRIWVHVSQVFDPMNLFNKILKELTSSQSAGQGESRQEILKRLQEALKDKTYLLVLDDVWNEERSEWEDFLNSLTGVTTTKGNGIIVTTRNTEVASIVGTLPIHHLKGLTEEDCWSIIRAKTFGNEDVPSDFESVGREIAERCGGLPLAASVVGGVLRDKSADVWRSIKQNWLSSKIEGDNNITKILRLSFNNLSSPSLKKCFAYCSIFRKGKQMVKEELIEMWMAEGFLQADGGDDMESVGDKFYNILRHSSLLQNVEAYEDWCVMHDLVHDLASSVLGSSNNAEGVTRVRYLIQEWESSPIKKEVSEHLRTLIFRAHQPSYNIFSDFKCLHVLTLWDMFVKELPRSIRKLKHLRNLNISETLIRHLPHWIGELHHLQTLRAENTRKLPSTIKYLINLRHLHVPYLKELPAEIGRLTSLQTLPVDFIVQDKNGYKIEELGSLNNLKGSLTIRDLEKVHNKEEAEKANLSKKSKISELRLKWTSRREEDESINDENVLEGLQPHSNLKKLQIWGFKGKRFPKWTLKMPSKITSLTDLVLEELNELESLPDELFYNNPNLSELEMRECPKLREIPDGLQTLNSLKKLIIEECPDLKRIGCSSGGRLASLAELRIRECHGLVDLPYEMVESSALVLERVTLKGLSSLTNLPRVIECLAKSAAGLRYLTIVGVPKFMAASVDQVWHLPKLWELKIDVSMEGSRETSVATVDHILQGCSRDSLRWLSLTGMEIWECLPESIQHLTSLYELELKNFGMEELPEWFHQYISHAHANPWPRFKLKLSECKRLRRLPSTHVMRCLIEEKRVEITDCPNLTTTK